jgi:hypothetical protein
VQTPGWLAPPTVRATFFRVVVAVSWKANTCISFEPVFVACTVSACGDEPCVYVKELTVALGSADATGANVSAATTAAAPTPILLQSLAE